MRVSKYKEEWFNLVRKNIIFLIIIGVLSITNIIMASMYVFKMNDKMVVIVPPKVDKSFVIQGNKASKGYIESTGVFLVSLINNYTPKNIRDKFNSFLEYSSPDSYHALKDYFNKRAEKDIKAGITQEFYPKSAKVYEDRVEISGLLTRKLEEGLEDKYSVKVIIYYKINNIGKFEVNKYEVKKISS